MQKLSSIAASSRQKRDAEEETSEVEAEESEREGKQFFFGTGYPSTQESSRHGRQYLVNFPGPAAGATLLESGLFQKPELNPPCRTEEGL